MIEADAEVDPSAWIGPNAYVGAGARYGALAQIGPNSIVFEHVVVGAATRAPASVT